MLADHTAHTFPHRKHGHVHPKGKKPHTDYQQYRAKEEKDQCAGIQRCNGNGQQKDNGCDGKDSSHGFLIFQFKLFVEMQETLLSFQRDCRILYDYKKSKTSLSKK